MPTIEIASFNSTGLGLNHTDFEITIIEENKLESHRGLFYELLRQQSGTIVHIGNPDFKNQKDGGFYAGEIIDWSIDPNEEITIPINNLDSPIYYSGANQQFRFRFLNQYKADIDKLLETALNKSPIKKSAFSPTINLDLKKKASKLYILYRTFGNDMIMMD